MVDRREQLLVTQLLARSVLKQMKGCRLNVSLRPIFSHHVAVGSFRLEQQVGRVRRSARFWKGLTAKKQENWAGV